jgi:hypothetical protein
MLLMHDADLKVGVYKLSNWTEKWEKLHESGRESEGTAFQTDKEKGACMPHTFRPTLTPLLDIMQLSTCLSAD